MSLALGQTEEVFDLVPHILVDEAGPGLKACGHGPRAAGLLLHNRAAEARNAFSTVLEYCVVALSLGPIAQLPCALRTPFFKATATNPIWTSLARSFARLEVVAATLQQLLINLPETMVVAGRGREQLSSRKASLLFALEARKPIGQIAQDLGLVDP